MANSTIDTPDNQRGVVSAQLKLATVAGGTTTATVTVPPNTETLIVIGDPPGVGALASCRGVTTGIYYLGTTISNPTLASADVITFFDVTSVIDQQVTIAWDTAPASTWYVYSDAGVHLAVDPSKRSTHAGVQFVVPVPPGFLSTDHPAPEIIYQADWGKASGTVILPTLSGGTRYRIFYAQVIATNAGAVATINDQPSGNSVAVSGVGVAGQVGSNNFAPSGSPLSNNGHVIVASTAGTIAYNIAYTTENT